MESPIIINTKEWYFKSNCDEETLYNNIWHWIQYMIACNLIVPKNKD